MRGYKISFPPRKKEGDVWIHSLQFRDAFQVQSQVVLDAEIAGLGMRTNMIAEQQIGIQSNLNKMLAKKYVSANNGCEIGASIGAVVPVKYIELGHKMGLESSVHILPVLSVKPDNHRIGIDCSVDCSIERLRKLCEIDSKTIAEIDSDSLGILDHITS